MENREGRKELVINILETMQELKYGLSRNEFVSACNWLADVLKKYYDNNTACLREREDGYSYSVVIFGVEYIFFTDDGVEWDFVQANTLINMVATEINLEDLYFSHKRDTNFINVRLANGYKCYLEYYNGAFCPEEDKEEFKELD